MLDDELFNARSGTTDSELMFLLALQFGLRDAPIAAMAEMVSFVEGLAENILGGAHLRFTAAFSDGRSLYRHSLCDRSQGADALRLADASGTTASFRNR